MADVNRGNRPLSPHLQIYRPQITSVLSILHRATGAGLAVASMLVVWWFIAAATGPVYFAFVEGLLTSVLGHLVLIAALWGIAYHLCNGIRHLWWDMGLGYDLDKVTLSGQVAVAASVALTVLVLLVAGR